MSDNMGHYVPTPEEQMIFRECESESFWFRCLPFQILGGGGVYAGHQTGRLTSSSNKMMALKICSAVVAGFLLGKISYVRKCEDKFVRRNTPIGDMIRRRRYGV